MRRFSSLMLGLSAASLGVVLASTPAAADPSAAVTGAVITMSRQPSYHFSMSVAGESVEGDMVNPGKYHVVMKNAETIMIGPTFYMKMNGKWTKSVGMTPSSQTDVVKEMNLHRADYTSQDLGMRAIDGAPLHAYSVTNVKKNTTTRMYVDAGGRIARIDVAGSVMRFSRFGEAVSIVAPM
jgi:hypothetical protein